MAIEYESNFEKSQKLVLDYIRAGKYNDNDYLGTGKWENTAGKIDTKFIDYVNEKAPNIQSYLYTQDEKGTKYIKDPVTNKLIDFSHMAVTFSSYLHDTNDFKMWVGSWFSGIPNYTEDDLDNLAGWVGDIQSMVQTDLLIYYDTAMGKVWDGDHYFDESVLNKHKGSYFKDLFLKLLEDKPQDDNIPATHILLNDKRIQNTHFKIEDQLADIDAVNLYVNCYRPNNKTTIADCLDRYYSGNDSSRFCKLRYDVFIDNVFSMDDDRSYDSKYWDLQKAYHNQDITLDEFKYAITDIFYDYTLKYTMANAPDGKRWTLYFNAPVTENVSRGAARGFAEYIVSNWSF